MTTLEALQLLAGMPGFLETVASRFPGQKALEAGPEDDLCFLEQVWHLADLEACQGQRIGRILAEERPALADFDGAREAREGRYRERDLAAGLASFRRARAASLELLRDLSEAQWRRPATQEGVGALTLADVTRRMAEHDASHRGEIGALLGEAPRPEAPRSHSSPMATAMMLLLVVPLLGCPYDSPFPIGAPADAPRDPRLLGDWHCASAWDEKAFTTAITPYEERQYSIVMSMPEEKPLACRAYVSTLKGSSILNLQGVEDGKPEAKWMFVRYFVPTPDSLVLQLAEDELLKEQAPQTAAALQAVLEGPKRDEIFRTAYACARAEARK